MNASSLREDLEWITGRALKPEGVSLGDILARLDALAEDSVLPEALAHYLSKRSYVKALEWLDHPEMPHQP